MVLGELALTPRDELLAHILPGFTITTLRREPSALTITAHPTAASAACPSCGVTSERVHSHYVRSPRDLPISDAAVQLRLRVRRFRCLNPDCRRATFAERLPLVRPWAQQTQRRLHRLQPLATALSGEAASRLSEPLGLSSSPDALLGVLRRLPLPATESPLQIGLDDWALRKGRVYGTIIVDLAQRQPIDLLPDRTVETVAEWLRAHPSVEVVARDRRSEYARGITTGAPQAVQVADRWHLLANLRDAAELLLRRVHRRLEALPLMQQIGVPRRRPQQRSQAELVARQASHHERYARYQTIRQLAATGMSYRAIARQLGVAWLTVERYAEAETLPEFAPRQPLASLLDPYLRYLHQQWTEGCTNAAQLWREIEAQGYRGGYRQVARWAQQQRLAACAASDRDAASPEEAPAVGSATTSALPSARQLAWLLVRDPNALEAEEQGVLAHIQQDADVACAYDLAQRFGQLVRKKQVEALDAWLEDAIRSTLPELKTFANGLQQDLAAVRAALEHSASNGQTEGQVNRLKLIKRQGYGRASFDLLRKRVLAA